MKLINNQKGISQIVTIMLIILTVTALVTVFLTWSKDFSTTKLSQSSEKIRQASNIECLNSDILVESCKIDPYHNHIRLMLLNESDLDFYGISLNVQARDDYNNTVKFLGNFNQSLEKGNITSLSTADSNDFTFTKESGLFSSIDVNNIDLITLSSGTCPQKVIDITDCDEYTSIYDQNLLGWWIMDRNHSFIDLNQSDWISSYAYGLRESYSFFSQTGDDIDINSTDGTWHGTSRSFYTSEKTRYRIQTKVKLNNGKLRLGYHLYKDGNLVDYDAPDDTSDIFDTYHGAAMFNYDTITTTGWNSVDTVIDLNGAPDFDSINLAILSELGTESPYIEFKSSDIKVEEVKLVDSSGNNNNGEVIGDFTLLDSNYENEVVLAFPYSVTNDSFELPFTEDFGMNNFTFSFWLNVPESSEVRFLSNLGGSSGVVIKHTDNDIQFYLRDVNGNYLGYLSVISNVDFITKFAHITLVFNREQNKIFGYYDGEYYGSVDISSITGEITPGSNYIKNYYGNYDTSSAIGDLRLYERALSENEIKDIYNFTKYKYS